MLPTRPRRPPRCARGASAAQQLLQCSAQEFSQTEAKLADSICKPRCAVLESCCRRAPRRPPRCARGASAAQQQLQCGSEKFSQTEAKLAESICKPRRAVLESCCLSAPAALRGAPGELARRSSSFNAALRSSARLRQNSQTQVCKPRRFVLESFGLRAPAALRGAPGAASMRRSGVQPD